jgi:hypothetical protein
MLLSEDLEPEQARDGTFPIRQLGKIATIIQPNTELLLRHERSDLVLVNSDKNIVIVARIDPKSNTRYLYVINQDADASHTASVVARGVQNISSVIDIYTGRNLDWRQLKEGAEISYTLAPGEALFVRLEELQP